MHLRKFILPALIAALPLAAAPASAQLSPACAGRGPVEDACQKASDVFSVLAPQLGIVVAGGNAALGQSSTLGGLGHLALGVRATGLKTDLPDVGQVDLALNGAQRSNIPVTNQWAGLPAVELGVGLFRGIPVGLSYVGGVDALVTATWLPEISTDEVSITVPSGSVKFGGGLRVGVLQETAMVPGVSLTWVRRELPSADVVARTDAGDTLAVNGTRVRADSWRLVAGKSFAVLALTGGVGQDRMDARADVSAVVRSGTPIPARLAPVPLSQKVTRSNAFVGLSINAAVVRLSGEIGRSWGGTIATYNDFEGTTADAPRIYGAVGLMLGF